VAAAVRLRRGVLGADAHHIAKLPGIAKPGGANATFTVPDTIEGWADALGVLLSSYFSTRQPFPE
jgi:ribonucleoside-diphosphate reductase alpha chain